MKTHSKMLFLYLQLAAHFLVGFNEPVLVVHHDAVVLFVFRAQPKGHLHLLFLTDTSQGDQHWTVAHQYKYIDKIQLNEIELCIKFEIANSYKN